MGKTLATISKAAEAPVTAETAVETAPITTDSAPETAHTGVEKQDATHDVPTDAAPVESTPMTLEDSNKPHPVATEKVTALAASVAYEAVRAHERFFGDYSSPKWEDASSQRREEAVALIEYLIENPTNEFSDVKERIFNGVVFALVLQ